jgi:hypothetical protein
MSMKPTLLSTVLFAGLTLPLAAASSGTLTDSERAFLIQTLEQTKKGFLASINGVSDAQWRFKPDPKVWSVAECAEHIVLAEDFIAERAQMILKSPAVERPATSNSEVDHRIVMMVEDRSQKAQAPEPIVPSGKFNTPAEAAAEFVKRRDRNIAYVRTTQDDLRVHIFKGPPLGSADAYQFMLLMAAHSARHTAQIREVQANAGYPGAGAAKVQFLVGYTLARNVPVNQLTEREMTILGEHAQYLKRGLDNGVLTWGGHSASPNNLHGFVLLEVASEDEARAFSSGDPAVKAGVVTTTVEPFTELFRKK